MRVYISGPITGIKNHNAEAFAEREAELLARGFDVVNPQKLNTRLEGNPTHADYMRESIKLLMTCQLINFLDGWTESVGARFENETAKMCGIECLDL